MITLNNISVAEEDKMPESIYDFTMTTITGEEKSLADYKGKVLLIVNTASKCGHTKQFGPLEELYQKYKDQGFVILGFPCNQFAGQDPGTSEEILEFCQMNYGVTFPMFEKIKVNGKEAHPLYNYLKANVPEGVDKNRIKWNFTKFLINSDGEIVDRFVSKQKPNEIDAHVAKLLGL
jgi:glutathione peroxidase